MTISSSTPASVSVSTSGASSHDGRVFEGKNNEKSELSQSITPITLLSEDRILEQNNTLILSTSRTDALQDGQNLWIDAKIANTPKIDITDIQLRDHSDPLTLITALKIAGDIPSNLDDILENLTSLTPNITPAAGTGIVVDSPNAADMLALQDILANMEPASGDSGSSGPKNSSGFNSNVDPAILLGLDRLGAILATAGLYGLDGESDRRFESDLNLRNIPELTSINDTDLFDGFIGVSGQGNILDNDTTTSGGLVLKTILFNNVIHDVPSTGPLEIVGTMGVLSILATGDYTYTPLNASDIGTDISGVDLFTYTASDAAGLTSTATLAITVQDSIPVALDDIITADHMNLVRSGNLISGDQGGNGPLHIATINGQPIPINGLTIDNPALGYQLIIQTDGSYTLTADNLRTGTDTLTYTTVDRDGDPSGTATIALNFSDTAPIVTSKIISSTNMNLVSEGELITGADVIPDGGAHIAILGGVTLPPSGSWIMDTVDYTLTVSESGHFRLEGKNGHTTTNVTIPFTIADSDGDLSNTVNITLSVADALPIAVASGIDLQGHLDIATQMISGYYAGAINLASHGDAIERFTLDSSAVGSFGSITLNENGTWSYALNASKTLLTSGVELVENFTYTVTDADGDTSTSNISVRIGSDGTWEVANLLPIAADGPGGTSIGEVAISGNIISSLVTSGNGVKTITSININGGPALTVSATDTTHEGTFGRLTIRGDGTYRYVGKDDLVGPETITYTVRDADGDTDTGILTLAAHDHAPTAVADTASVQGTLNIDTQMVTRTLTVTAANGVLANDTDGDGIKTVVTTTVIGTFGTLTLSADGSYTYNLNASKLALQGSPSESFSYTMRDADGDTSTATLSIGISPDGTWSTTNQLPLANADTNASTAESTVNGNVITTGPGADQLGDGQLRVVDVRLGSGAPVIVGTGVILDGTNGRLILNSDGSYAYRGFDDRNGTDTFTYTIMDRDGDKSSTTLTLNASDATPTSGNIIGSVSGDTFTTVSLSGNLLADARGGDGTLKVSSYAGHTVPVGSSITLNGADLGDTGIISLTVHSNGNYTLIGATGAYFTNFTPTFVISDQDGDIATVGHVLTVHNAETSATAPLVSANTLTFDEDSSGRLILNITNQDTNSERLTIRVTGIPIGWTITDLAGGTFTNGTWTRELSVGESLSNTGPVLKSPADWNGSLNLGVSAISTEINGDAVSSTISAVAAVTVTPVNDAPTIAATGPGLVSENVAAGTVVSGVTLSPADIDSLNVRSVIFGGNTNNAFSIDPITGNIITNTMLDRELISSYDLIIRAVDSEGLSSLVAQTVHIDVGNVNEAPILVTTPFGFVSENVAAGTVVAGVTGTGTTVPGIVISATDIDSIDLRFGIVGGNINNAFTINAITGVITTTASLDYESISAYDIEIHVVDPDGLSSSLPHTVHIDIGNVNEAPTLVATGPGSVSENVVAGTVVSGLIISATDIDSPPPRFEIMAGNTGNAFTINASTGAITTAAVLNFEAINTYVLTIEAYDTGGLRSGTQTVRINVGDVNENIAIVLPATGGNGAPGVGGAGGGAPGTGAGGVTDSSGAAIGTGSGGTLGGSGDVDSNGDGNSGPLVLDLNHNGIELISIHQGIRFDMTNDGIRDITGWVAASDGQLAVDLNGNGIIDNQHELFGQPMGTSLDINGFTDLSTFDNTHDGKVDAMDSVWSKLIVWQDLNQDGISQVNEMKSVTEYDIASISTDAVRVNETVAENHIYWDGNITLNDGSSMDIVDAYYQVIDGTKTDNMSVSTSAIDAAISETLVGQLSSDQTSDIDAAIHEFLILTGTDTAAISSNIVTETTPYHDIIVINDPLVQDNPQV